MSTAPSGRRPRRPRRLLWVVAAVLALPLVELLVVIALGQAVGGWQTFALLVALSLLGVLLLRREGPAAWRRFQDTVRAGRTPSREAADGVLVLFGGLLLVLPGLVSDVVGLVCVLPLTRPLARRALLAWVLRAASRLPGPRGGWVGGPVAGGPVTGGPAGGPGVGGPVVPGEVVQGRVVDPGDVEGEVVEGEVLDGDEGDRPAQDGRH